MITIEKTYTDEDGDVWRVCEDDSSSVYYHPCGQSAVHAVRWGERSFTIVACNKNGTTEYLTRECQSATSALRALVGPPHWENL